MGFKMNITEKERVAIALAMQYPNQVITEKDVEMELKRLHIEE